MTAPAGTFLAQVREGAIQFPSPLRQWCEQAQWNLFQVSKETPDCLLLTPVLPGSSNDIEGHHSSFDSRGRLWIPAELRSAVALEEQSVMIRVEGDAIRVFLRKVFETLGFGP